MSDTNALGVPYEDLEPVVVSYLKARAKDLSNNMEDPIRSYPIFISKNGRMQKELKQAIMDQLINQSGSGKRLDRIKSEALVMRENYLRKLWICEKWVSFEPIINEITEEHLNTIGLCYLTDETASQIIESVFPRLGEFSKKQYEDFRKKNGLIQVPLAHRRSGFLLNGVMDFKRVGRKRV